MKREKRSYYAWKKVEPPHEEKVVLFYLFVSKAVKQIVVRLFYPNFFFLSNLKVCVETIIGIIIVEFYVMCQLLSDIPHSSITWEKANSAWQHLRFL